MRKRPKASGDCFDGLSESPSWLIWRVGGAVPNRVLRRKPTRRTRYWWHRIDSPGSSRRCVGREVDPVTYIPTRKGSQYLAMVLDLVVAQTGRDLSREFRPWSSMRIHAAHIGATQSLWFRRIVWRSRGADRCRLGNTGVGCGLEGATAGYRLQPIQSIEMRINKHKSLICRQIRLFVIGIPTGSRTLVYRLRISFLEVVTHFQIIDYENLRNPWTPKRTPGTRKRTLHRGRNRTYFGPWL